MPQAEIIPRPPREIQRARRVRRSVLNRAHLHHSPVPLPRLPGVSTTIICCSNRAVPMALTAPARSHAYTIVHISASALAVTHALPCPKGTPIAPDQPTGLPLPRPCLARPCRNTADECGKGPKKKQNKKKASRPNRLRKTLRNMVDDLILHRDGQVQASGADVWSCCRWRGDET